MDTKIKRTAIVVVVGATALGAGLGLTSLASADPTPTPSSSAAPADGPGRAGHGRDGIRGGADAAALATKLGVDQAKVSEALQSIRDARRVEAPPPADGTSVDPAARDAELAKSLASKLGIDEAKVKTALTELRTERQAGARKALATKLDSAVQAGTLTRADADSVLKAADSGVIGMGGGGPR